MHEVKEIQKELRAKTVGYISAALGLVAGLAWNEAITELINTLFPVSKDTVLVKFVYAIAVTIAVVILIKYIDKVINKES